MKTKYDIAIAIATLAVLAALCTTASAGDYGSGCAYSNFYNGTLENGGGIYFDVKGHYDNAGATQSYTFENVPDGRQVVRMYPGIWLGSPSPGRVTEWSIEINGHTDYFNFTEPGSLPFCNLDCLPEDGTGEHCTVSCTGCGVCSVTYNAGPYVVTGDNNVTYWTDEQIYQVGLLAVYANASMEKLQYWVKEGQEYPDTAPYHAYFNESSSSGPIDTGNISAVEYYTYGYPHCPGESGWPNLNGNYIGSPNITKDNQYAPVFYGWTEIPPAYIAAPDNCFLYPTLGNDRMMVPVLGILYSAESIDLLPPYTEGHDPAPGATDVPSNTDIVVHVKDDGTGVDQSTIAMTVEGAPVAPVITGTPADYTVTYTPGSRFECGQVVNVTVDASDLASPSNVMSTDSYSFTIMSAATPFLIYGWVNDSDSDPVNDPDVTVTNTNTSEIYEVENITTSNYYQVSTSSETVSAGNVLHFVAVKETTTEFDYVVTVADMNRGGFVQNITIDKTPRPDLIVTQVNAYHYDTSAGPWFNLTNEIDVKVENTGEVNAGAFNVNLTIDDGFYGEQNVPGLNVGENVTLTFTGWVPVGDECFSNCALTETYHDYNITGVADCNNAVDESDEENNAITIDGEDGRACYNGYTGDEPLENVLHGTLKGHLNFTTGNGTYGGLYSVNVPKYTEYEITIPEGATMELAKLNLYYTWHYEASCPVVEVSITNGTGTYVVPLETSYNDMKCHCPTASWRLPWGNYVYDVTDYVTGSGTYIVNVTRTGGSSVCLAASGIVYVYADDNAPTIEYWLNEGADVLIGGRRYDGGYLAWWECINNATFPASTVTDDVATVTLGVVTPWGDDVPDDILSFNDIELGRGVYSGYSNTVDETINGMSMYIGSTNAQLGVNMTDVTAQYLNASENMVSQADDGDNMMPSNAFLVVEYAEEEEKKDDAANADIPVKGTVTGSYVDTNVSDNVYEAITEVLTTGNPVKNRYSYLEHKWTINVTTGTKANVTFYLEAYHSPSSDGDDFEFAYSTDDSNYINMDTCKVIKTADDNTSQTYELPETLSGTVYIRVRDTDQTKGNQDLDTIYIDHMFIRSVFATPSYGVDVTIDEASQTVTPGNSTTYTVSVKNTGDLEASYSVVMSGTAVDEPTITVSPLNWNTGTLAPNAENVTTVTVSTTASTTESTYNLTATATCDQDASVTDSATSELVVSSAEYTDDKAKEDIPVKGTVSGSYLDTHSTDNVYESIEEIVQGPKSLLEHKWTIDVTGGSSVTFYVEAYHTVNTENDDFAFAYSTDDSTYTDMVTVTKTDDDDMYQTYELPDTISGTVYIRVMDTDRTNGNKALDTVYIDHMYIRSESGAPSYGVTVTIDEASQTVKPGNSTTYTVRVKNTGDLEASYNVVMSGTAVDESTIDVSPFNWNTGILAPNAENVTTVTVSTAASTPETTYTLTAMATCDQDVSVSDSATSELVVSSAANTMHVYSIDMWYTKAGPNYKIYTEVKIVDSSDAPVAGATVHLNTTLPDGTNVSSSDVTGDDGTVEFMYGPTKTTGDYSSTVTDVAKDGWTYDPVANVVTSETLPVP